MIKRIVWIIAGLFWLIGPVQAIELLTWERLPLTIPLVVGEERAVFVDRNVRIGMEPGIADRLRVQSAAGVIYLKAVEELPPSRLQVQVVETGEIIIFDVATIDSDEPLEPVRIVDARMATVQPPAEEAESFEKKVNESIKIPAPVALTRYAAQSLYAPLRTVAPVPGLRKVQTGVSGKLRLHPTETIIGEPLVAYKLGSYTVTAVKLVNTSPLRIELDPRKLQGNFYSVTFMHQFLGATRTAEDTTVVYLVTKDSNLAKALLPSAFIEEPEEKDDQNRKQKAKTFASQSNIDDDEGGGV